ncbi:hypothetical protein Tco_0040707 [Tanacetum coccineum]
MHPGKSLSKHIDEFHKLVGDLAAMDTAISDKGQALLLPTSLPSSYNNFVKTSLYGQDTLKLEDVLTTLNSSELQKMTEAKGDGGEGSYVKGRSGNVVYGGWEYGFNESGEHNKTFIGSGVSTGSMYREDSNKVAFAVVEVEKIYAHKSLTFNDSFACEEKQRQLKRLLLGAEIWAPKGLLAEAKGNILDMKIVKDQSGNTLMVSQSRVYNVTWKNQKEHPVEIDLPYRCTQGLESDCKGKETEISDKKPKQLDSNIVDYTASPKVVKKDIAEKLYQMLSLSMYRIIQEIDRRKIYVGTDMKRDHNRIKKGRMDLEYMMECLVHKIQHGNSKQADKAKLYHEIRKLNETIEIHTAPTEPADPPKWSRGPGGSSDHK